jgi:hypothetical protein
VVSPENDEGRITYLSAMLAPVFAGLIVEKASALNTRPATARRLIFILILVNGKVMIRK